MKQILQLYLLLWVFIPSIRYVHKKHANTCNQCLTVKL